MNFPHFQPNITFYILHTHSSTHSGGRSARNPLLCHSLSLSDSFLCLPLPHTGLYPLNMTPSTSAEAAHTRSHRLPLQPPCQGNRPCTRPCRTLAGSIALTRSCTATPWLDVGLGRTVYQHPRTKQRQKVPNHRRNGTWLVTCGTTFVFLHTRHPSAGKA